MTTRQPQSGQPKASIDQQVKNAGRERNTLGQTESETAYWRSQYQSEPYYRQGESFSDYEPAYRTGIEARSQYDGQRCDEVQANVRSDWEGRKGNSPMGWDKASQACRAAWEHAGLQQRTTGSDNPQHRQ